MSHEYVLKPYAPENRLNIDYAGELNPQQLAAVTARPRPGAFQRVASLLQHYFETSSEIMRNQCVTEFITLGVSGGKPVCVQKLVSNAHARGGTP